MKYSFYDNLSSLFYKLENLYGQERLDETELLLILNDIREARKKIKTNSQKNEKEVLLYCIDTLFLLKNEGETEKILDYVFVIKDIPKVYMQRRNLYSFVGEIKRFRRKYGEEFFPFINSIKPNFTRKAPKNKWKYFLPDSDDEFKAAHPTGYKLLCALGIFALMLPQILYLVCIIMLGVTEDWQVMLGYVGSFIVGIGLFNIVAAFVHQYLGHLVTVICIFGGSALTLFALSLLI